MILEYDCVESLSHVPITSGGIITLFKIPPLAFAVGVYLPIESMTPVFLGGLIRYIVEKKTAANNTEKGKDQGILLGSGLIAGEGLMGVVIAIIAVVISGTPKFTEVIYPMEWIGEVVSLTAFAVLGWYLYRIAVKSRQV